MKAFIARLAVPLAALLSTLLADGLGMAAAHADTAPLSEPAAWSITHASAERLTLDGRPVVHLIAAGDSANGVVGLDQWKASSFTTGTIEVHLRGQNVRQRSFLGVAFNIVDERTFEAVYFRPFNFKAEPPFNARAVQYIAWPANTWEHLRRTQPGRFENTVQPVPDPDGWFHATIAITQREVRVFVNRAQQPSLVVERLATGGVARPIGLFVDSADGWYANLRVAGAAPNQ